MGVFLSKRGSIMSEIFTQLSDGELVDIALYEDYIEISETVKLEKNKNKVRLLYPNVTGIFYGRKDKKLLLIISYRTQRGADVELKFEDTRHLKGRKLVKKLEALTGVVAYVPGKEDKTGTTIEL